MLYWCSVEGLDAAGKTTLCEGLHRSIGDLHPYLDVRRVDEFSSTPLGNLLRKQLATGDRLFLGMGSGADEKMTSAGLTLLLLADAHYLSATLPSPGTDRTVVVSDRGPISRAIYQEIVMVRSGHDIAGAREWIRSVTRFLPIPDRVLYLDVSESTMCKRAVGRGEAEFTDADLQILGEVRAGFQRRRDADLTAWTTITADNDPIAILKDAMDVVRADLYQRGLVERGNGHQWRS